MNRKKNISHGTAQLTLVEHCLCPLDANASLIPGLTHTAQFGYSKNGKRRIGNASLHLPLGLSAADEFTLWGMLALTLRQPEQDSHFAATPHYCLRQLGGVNAGSNRGGKNYRQFRESIRRIAAATYQCDAFYDPIRKEHSQVSFGFFSYRLPHDPLCDRLWHFHWDPLFFQMCDAFGGQLSFDLGVYRSLSPAGRRLFLFLHKLFHRTTSTPFLDVRSVAENVLGFSPSLGNGDINRKVKSILADLDARDVIRVTGDSSPIQKRSGRFVMRLHRGPYFNQRRRAAKQLTACESSLVDALISLGFDSRDAGRIRRRYAASLIREWVDITVAAKSSGRIRKSAQAYLVDSLKHAAAGKRTAPDWWNAMRKSESRVEATDHWKRIQSRLGAKTESTQDGVQRIGELLSF